MWWRDSKEGGKRVKDEVDDFVGEVESSVGRSWVTVVFFLGEARIGDALVVVSLPARKGAELY